MTSEASDLPDWKDQIPWCLATEVGNSIFSNNLNRSKSRCPEREDLGEIMANCGPSFQRENQRPQPRCSGCPLEVRVVEVVPGPSGPCAEGSAPPQSASRKRKRAWPTEEEPASGAQDFWVVESLCGLKMKLKRRRVSSVRPEHHQAFTRLLEDPVIKRFLAWDTNLRLSDKYLLSMVVAYFSRVGLFSWQYQRIHFFLALYLALDMEENYHAPKEAILSFLYGENSRSQRPLFHKQRFQFFCSMGMRAMVTQEECEEIQAFDPELWVWGRDRALLSEATKPKEGPKEGGSVSSQVQREGFVVSLRNPRNPMAGPTLIVPLPITRH
ncbi:speedy protein E4-like [Pipistrellus kuhlii]|uniref:speedy protein E4-like n=1 Tax=Pipistrellus kuhlii TaxID=59472 RepID=UPI001E27205A|nr:speedy protein E4-like [Pipistrellus kuhlii]